VYTTIAWATDCSPSAFNALTVAKGLARQFGAKLAIIHVQELTIGRGGIVVDANEAAVAALHRTAQQLRHEGIEATVSVTRARASAAPRAIVDLVTGADADIVIIGNQGHGPLAGLVLGSVALRLLEIAPCAVLVVPSRQPSGTSPAVAELAPTTAPVRA
jgi:nucleotide-binding universal stress UspA family protein